LRILHTSDWHLGISTGPASRAEEQAIFLRWLLDLLRTREVDVLIIAGDIFDSMHPSAEAQTLLFRFLASVEHSGVCDVVLIGGNHDSASRLDAPRALLEAVRVHVVGGVPTADDRGRRMLAPLHVRGSDEPAAVCLAVPYVHEYRLGIRTSDLDVDATRARFRQEFAALYSGLADQAEAEFPGLPIIATGHLTLGRGATSDDYPQPIHQVGTIEGLPVDILDPRIRYAALGHIHRCYPIAGSTAWYCGTPVPYSMKEMDVKRRVLLVELEGEDKPRVEQIEVPRSRDLVQLIGSPEDVMSELVALTWSTLLPPLVHVRVETSIAVPGLTTRMHEAVGKHPREDRPVLVEVQQRSALVAEDGPVRVAKSLKEMNPEQVFSLICDHKQLTGDDRAKLEVAFRTAEATRGEVLEAMLQSIDLPQIAAGDVS
jgi:exonuclease SbcD